MEAAAGPRPADAADQSVVETTYHSTILSSQWKGTSVIVKKCRHLEDLRTPKRWRSEVDALKFVGEHENITTLLDSDPSELTITLRLEPGKSLDRHVDSEMKATLSPADSDILWKQMAGALSHIHARSIIHDDVKPENIVWSPEQKHAVLIDFGAALDFNVLPTDFFNPSGTPNYAGPDFLSKKKGPKGDIWALGVTILFAYRYIKLPDGEWLLPAVWDEGKPREEMLEWLEQIETLRKETESVMPLISDMLNPDQDARIGSAELVKRLEL
ncbi:kinase-like protein [Thozetella sp. PMI_491]|nr:kinase-like protein [Thozetella sp. PMI_491]